MFKTGQIAEFETLEFRTWCSFRISIFVLSSRCWFNLRHRQKLPHALRIVDPLLSLLGEPFPARGGQLVPLSLPARAVVPYTADEPVRLKPVKNRIQRSRRQIDPRAAGLADFFLDEVTIFLPAREDR